MNLASTQYHAQNNVLIATENYLYQNGHLKEIKLNNSVSIWNLTSVNAFGQPTGVTTGGYERTYGYSAYGMPTSRTAKVTNASTNFFNHTYNFNHATGNLNHRKDNSRTIPQENFGYDHLNRLNSFGGNTAAYMPNGNITLKTSNSERKSFLR